jgi:hypothetical protein
MLPNGAYGFQIVQRPVRSTRRRLFLKNTPAVAGMHLIRNFNAGDPAGGCSAAKTDFEKFDNMISLAYDRKKP